MVYNIPSLGNVFFSTKHINSRLSVKITSKCTCFWTKQSVRSTLQKVLDSWCHDQMGQFYTKQLMTVDDVNMQNCYTVMAEQKHMGPAEGGFLECLFELWKIRSRIVKAKS